MPRFSHRLAWDTPENPLARLLDERRAAGAPLLDLTLSNPTAPAAALPYPAEAVRAALALPGALRHEPSPRGLAVARRAVADHYAARGAPIDPEHVVLTASTSEAYSFLFKLLCDPGDVVLVPQPSYPLFDFLAALDGVRPEPYLLGFDDAFHLDFAALQQSLDEAGDRARAILLVSPNNPTGTYLKQDERERLVALAAERDLALIGDEVFADYALAADPTRADTLATETSALAFTLSGLSKIAGLPQLKLGWIVAAGPPALRDAALRRLDLVADTYLSVGAPVQHAAPALLALAPSIVAAISARTRANLAALQQMTRGTACQLLPVEGGWYAIVRVPAVHTDEAWALTLLRDDDVLVQPGYFYDFPREAYLVVSLLPTGEIFREGARRLVARVAASS